MPTTTRNNPSTARFGRTSSAATTGRGRFARGTTTPRRSMPTTALRRRKPQQSTVKRAMSAILPAAAAKKAAPSSKKGKAGGLALAAAAAGMAIKNRGKLTQMVHKDHDTATPRHDATTNSVTPPSTPTV
ncbi:MAG TPA: hypothetical protein VE526_04835 [Solirubrobacteraceae bacterium]|jgi:hypothetical protein|nr:hypothetical protein [Solirubrobacteraceae bacterium]